MTTDILAKTKTKISKPSMYNIIFHNDDYTPMDFVVEVLTTMVHRTMDDAFELMMKVHFEGACIVMTTTRDIAETKSSEITAYARSKGHPLMVSVEHE